MSNTSDFIIEDTQNNRSFLMKLIHLSDLYLGMQ